MTNNTTDARRDELHLLALATLNISARRRPRPPRPSL